MYMKKQRFVFNASIVYVYKKKIFNQISFYSQNSYMSILVVVVVAQQLEIISNKNKCSMEGTYSLVNERKPVTQGVVCSSLFSPLSNI